MKYRILAVGLKDDLISQCRNYFSGNRIEIRTVPDVNEMVNSLKEESFRLLLLDMKYLRNIGQDAWIINIRYISLISIIVLSDIPDADIGPTVKEGADVCYVTIYAADLPRRTPPRACCAFTLTGGGCRGDSP